MAEYNFTLDKTSGSADGSSSNLSFSFADSCNFSFSEDYDRNFDNETGRFISRKPLGYVDVHSLYNGYFAEGFILFNFESEHSLFEYPSNTTRNKSTLDSLSLSEINGIDSNVEEWSKNNTFDLLEKGIKLPNIWKVYNCSVKKTKTTTSCYKTKNFYATSNF